MYSTIPILLDKPLPDPIPLKIQFPFSKIEKGPEIADHAFALLLDPSRDFKKYLAVRQRIKGRHSDSKLPKKVVA